MNHIDRELALRYLPHFYQDEADPFPIVKIGYSVLRKGGKSPTFSRNIEILSETAAVIEYAVYFDFDIQHLYDLEHVWIYIDAQGRVIDAEASSHGHFLNCFRLRRHIEDQTHLPVYYQPGKHAMSPLPEMFLLFTDYYLACDELAGLDGLLITSLFKGHIYKDEATDIKVRDYIRRNYRFRPSGDYITSEVNQTDVITAQELLRWIPQRIREVMTRLNF